MSVILTLIVIAIAVIILGQLTAQYLTRNQTIKAFDRPSLGYLASFNPRFFV